MKKRLEELTEDLDALPLECDGLTRVIHFVLHEAGIRHFVMRGNVAHNGERFSPHFWIVIYDSNLGPLIVDYRARMWLGPEAAHGVFVQGLSETEYIGEPVQMNMGPCRLLAEIHGVAKAN